MSVQSGTIASDEWTFESSSTIPEFMSVKFQDTPYDFGNVVKDAMTRVSNSILSGELFNSALKYINSLGLQLSGFDLGHLGKYLKHGEFKYTKHDPLFIGGEAEPEIMGRAYLNKQNIYLNAACITHIGHGHFPKNVAKLSALTGATIIHEVMHNHGYDHDGKPGDDVYESSFPEIAGEGFLLQQFPDNSLKSFFLSGSSAKLRVTCKTKA